MARNSNRRVIFLESNNCQLIKYQYEQKQGFYWWDMVSPKTGTHSVLSKSFTKRVRNHWNGFLSNQNK